jgi:NADH-quinone oxidoreductase subunit I
MSCQICVEVCPFDAIKMDVQFDLPTDDRFGGLLLDRHKLAKSNEYYHQIHPTEATAVDTALAAERAKAAAAKAAAATPKPAAPAAPAPAAPKPASSTATPAPAPVAPMPVKPAEPPIKPLASESSKPGETK